MKLYPFKFLPLFLYRIWRGEKLKTVLNKDYVENSIGESWELSTIPNNETQVAHGNLKGQTINELIEKYKHEGTIAGASCGSWWTEPNDKNGIPSATSMDGTPKGYFVFEFDGTDDEYEFIPENHPEDYRIRITLPLKTGSQFIIANWFIGKPKKKLSQPLMMKHPLLLKIIPDLIHL